VSALTLDMLHYCLGSFIWRSFYRSIEKTEVPEDEEIDHSDWLEIPLWILFCGKILLVLAAYFLIARYLLNAILLR